MTAHDADIEQARQRVAALSAQRPAALLCELRAAEDRLRELLVRK